MLPIEQIQSFQAIVHFANGDTLHSNVATRTGITALAAQAGVTDVDEINQGLQAAIDLFNSLGTLSTLTMEVGETQVAINPKRVNYIEIITT